MPEIRLIKMFIDLHVAYLNHTIWSGVATSLIESWQSNVRFDPTVTKIKKLLRSAWFGLATCVVSRLVMVDGGTSGNNTLNRLNLNIFFLKIVL